MKSISIHKTLLFFLLLLGSIYMNASDTLKIRKVRFFIEPEVGVLIPKHSPMAYNDFFNDYYMYLPVGCLPDNNDNSSWQNKSTICFGVSTGMSVRLSKYFNYELSLAYYHYNHKYQITETATDLSGNYLSSRITNYNISYKSLFISNGLSFKYKKFIFTNSIGIGTIEQTLLYDILNNNFSPYFGYSVNWYLMSEHKIGYSLFKNRIEPYVGINVLNNFRQNVAMPFTSVRINF